MVTNPLDLSGLTAKAYRLETQESGDRFVARVTGSAATLEGTYAYWSEIADRAITSGKKKVLVIEDVQGSISIADVHQLVSDLAELPVKDMRIAVIDLIVGNESVNEFGVLVGENRGLTVGLFSTEQEAVAWLDNN